MKQSNDPVWDLPVRAFHWSLPLLVGGAWLSEELAEMSAHAVCGYAVLVLVGWRILWGFLGSTHARFGSFLRSPAVAWRHLRGERHDVDGHNPAGGWSVVAMLLLLLLQALTGLFNEDDVSFTGPLAALFGGQLSGPAGEWHEWNFNLLLALVAVHVATVIRYQRRGQDLLRPMLNGGSARSSVTTRPIWLALILLGLCALALWFGLQQVPEPEVFI